MFGPAIVTDLFSENFVYIVAIVSGTLFGAFYYLNFLKEEVKTMGTGRRNTMISPENQNIALNLKF